MVWADFRIKRVYLSGYKLIDFVRLGNLVLEMESCSELQMIPDLFIEVLEIPQLSLYYSKCE